MRRRDRQEPIRYTRGAGKEVAIALLGEAAYLAKEAVANIVHGVGFPPLRDLIAKVVQAGVPVYV